MRKYKQVKEKKVIYSLDEWKLIEERAASVLMKTGTFIRQMSLDGQITFFNMEDVNRIMNALRIIGGNINQIAKKANEINSIHAEDIEKLQQEVMNLCRILNQSVFTAQSSVA
ncbi:MAG: MobC family plasmid mobilization relaxosome protein [Ruminococcaceae bacterium]|nr:MobC family plasmid mobilization relaxosome protein [Oscillospiraceae bacterium]